MRRLVPAFALLAITATVVSGAASGGPAARAQLQLMSPSPVTVRGTGFKAGERVRVAGHGPGMATRRMTATRTGAFTVGLGGVGARCTGFTVIATGDRGSRASVTHLPEQCGALP